MAEHLPDLPAGVYRHYKGPLYQVLGYGHDSNYEGRAVVVYIGLQLDGAKTGPRLAVRTAEDFHAHLHADGTTCYADPNTPAAATECALIADGKVTNLREWIDNHTARFEYFGPSWDGGES